MSHAGSVGNFREDPSSEEFQNPLDATPLPRGSVWKRRIQLLLIALIGWTAQNLGWGVSLAIHTAAAFILGFFLVPITLGNNSISLETRLGTESPFVELSQAVQENQASIGAQPIDLSPVAQEIGSEDPDESGQIEFKPNFLSNAASDSNSSSSRPRSGANSPLGDGLGDGQVEFFGTKGTGNSVVYVVDISGSMVANGRFQTAIDEILRSLDKLTKLQRFYILFYNHNELPLFNNRKTTKLLVANSSTKSRARNWIMRELEPGGGTNPMPALEHALRMRPDLIYLMTDGDIPDETRDFLQQTNTKKIVVHTIAFQNVDGRLILEEIAKDQGGTFRFVP